MKIMAFGKDLDGSLLFPPADEDALARALAGRLAQNAGPMGQLATMISQGIKFRGEAVRATIDPGDPLQVGWTFIVAEADPRRDAITSILRPLAERRKMVDPAAPLVFTGGSEETLVDWLQERFFGLEIEGKKVPQYVLLAGGPDVLPFRLQSLFACVASVGRVDFDDLADLSRYVEKLLRLEDAASPVVKREVVLFGTDEGPKDPTHYSRKYMVEPLAAHASADLGFGTRVLLGPEATRKNLAAALRGASPALVYTASHGVGTTRGTMEQRRRLNGAICCASDFALTLDDLFGAGDVPPDDEPFLEGAVFFQFACYGYGTPAKSDYAHWLEKGPTDLADADFVAALPKRLLAHPRGPIAYVGHLDTAYLHGFTDPNELTLDKRWHARIQPFVHAVDNLLRVQPSGLAMEDMSKRYGVSSAMLANVYNKQRAGKLQWTPDTERSLVDAWVFRNDAQNHMIFGDPAARLRIPA